MLTRYCCVFYPPEFPGSALLFSTRTAAALLVPAALIGRIERDTISGEERTTLAEHGFLVEDAATERQEMLGFLAGLAALDTGFKAIVVLNLDCNLACSYCFEGQRKGRHYLSDPTADRLLAFLRRVAHSGRQEIAVTFYGGEPLLSREMLASLAGRIGELAATAGIPFSFSLITNGTLLTRRCVEQLRPLGLRSACVTLDGPRDSHDAARPFRSGAGSYEAILRNLRDVRGLVDLKIGGNYQRENYREFPRLLDDLAANGLTPAVISHVKFDPVVREREGIVPPDFHGGCTSLSEPWLHEASVFLREETLRRGYRTTRIMPAICMVDFPGQIVIDHDGAIYKCTGLIGRPQFKAGDLEQGPTDCRPSHNFDSWKNDTCLCCPYLPLCFGGCRYLTLLRDGEMSGVDCRKPYFDAVLERLVAQDLRQR